MQVRDVYFSPEAEADLLALRKWLIGVAGRDICNRYFERVEHFCLGLAHASERGTARHDIRQGLRIVAFERSITIAFTVDGDRVTVLRVFYRGADWEHADQIEPH